RQVEVQQDEHVATGAHTARPVLAHQVIQGFVSAGERKDGIVDPRTADIFLDQPRMTFIVLDHDDRDWFSVAQFCFLLMKTRTSVGSITVNVVPCPSSELKVISPPRLRTNVRTCARPIPSPG